MVGTIVGGINTNVVPDEVTLRLDRRIIPEEIPNDVEAELRAVITSALQDLPGISCNVERILLASPFMPIGVPLYFDARLYAEAGVATVMYGAGPRTLLEANGHRADEKSRCLLCRLRRRRLRGVWSNY